MIAPDAGVFRLSLSWRRGRVTDERYAHVLLGHADLALAYWARVSETLADPDQVYRSSINVNSRLFSRWYDDLRKNIIVVAISDPGGRHWLATAYMTRKFPKDEVLWARN